MKVKENEESTEINAEGIRVFVYGTLKSGKGNWRHYLDNDRTVSLGRCKITGPFAMYDLGFFPCVIEDSSLPEAEIYGEVFLVDSDTLDSLDLLEGHPDWYCRRKIPTPWKNAWIYTMPLKGNGALEEEHYITSGCWNPSEEEAEWIANECA